MTWYSWTSNFNADVFNKAGGSAYIYGTYAYNSFNFQIAQKFQLLVSDGPQVGRTLNARQVLDYFYNKYYYINEDNRTCHVSPLDEDFPPNCYGSQYGWRPVGTIILGMTFKVQVVTNTTTIRGIVVNSTSIVDMSGGCVPIETVSAISAPWANSTTHALITNAVKGVTDTSIFTIPTFCQSNEQAVTPLDSYASSLRLVAPFVFNNKQRVE